MTSKTPEQPATPSLSPSGADPCSCVFTSPRSNSPERKLSGTRPQARLPFHVATAAGPGLSPDRTGLGRRGHPRGEERGPRPRAPGPGAGQGDPAGGRLTCRTR